jgi:hypothetical protein
MIPLKAVISFLLLISNLGLQNVLFDLLDLIKLSRHWQLRKPMKPRRSVARNLHACRFTEALKRSCRTHRQRFSRVPAYARAAVAAAAARSAALRPNTYATGTARL